MDVATVMTIIQTLLDIIQCSGQFNDICSLFNYQSDLETLQKTLETVLAILQDFDAKQDVLGNQEKIYIRQLKDAVYDAEDVLDEINTLAQLKQRNNNVGVSRRGCGIVKVRSLLNRWRPDSLKLSRKLKNVSKKLDGIAKNNQLSFKIIHVPPKFTKEETSSYVYANYIIGREVDLEEIVDMLLDNSSAHQGVSFLSIVGIGGLGKTALAQLVSNDHRVESAFPLRLWACVSDQGKDQLNLLDILGKLLESAPADNGQKHDASTLGEAQNKLGELMQEQRCLLVLDDLWTESRDQWLKLESFIKTCQSGSWVVITTRSLGTAGVVRGGRVHRLQGLSEDKSLQLFKEIAFEQEQLDSSPHALVQIGLEIVKRCAYVPLAIRAVASLLRGQSKERWILFKEKGLATISEDECDGNYIKSILKLSYHSLPTPLKSCFSFCALLPKGTLLGKEMLINLWLSQGFISSKNGQRAGDIGERFFQILFWRCFFQEVQVSDYGVTTCRIHDLMLEIAQDYVGSEMCQIDSKTANINAQVRHVYAKIGAHKNQMREKLVFSKPRIRTLSFGNGLGGGDTRVLSIVGEISAKCKYLRTLQLRGLQAKSLPKSIGELLHLRLLDLSGSKNLEGLPNSVTNLFNLLSLYLNGCCSLKELPRDMSKLVNLSSLHLWDCTGLTYMPPGIGTMKELCKLSKFVVGQPATSSGTQCCFDGLEDLKALTNLKCNLEINIRVWKDAKYVKENHGGGTYLMSKELLNYVIFSFAIGEGYGSIEDEELLLEELQPHLNLQTLVVFGYHGVRMPRWPMSREDNNSSAFHLPNLLELHLAACHELTSLPLLGKLSRLKLLYLKRLPKLEHLMDVDPRPLASSFFPCLEKLYLLDLPELKGWWLILNSGSVNSGSSYSINDQEPQQLLWTSCNWLPRLRDLSIQNCPRMRDVPVSPHLKTIDISDPIRSLLLKVMDMSVIPRYQVRSTFSKRPRKLCVSNLGWLKDMPAEYFESLAGMVIKGDKEVESLSQVEELFQTCFLSGLRFLTIDKCPKLKSVSGLLERLSTLQSLCISDCPILLEAVPWRKLSPSLQCLPLVGFEKMERLPDGMQYCTALQSLDIVNCPKLESLPNWMTQLTSLRRLKILYCSKQLKQRCQDPDGEDWPLIQHIPHTLFRHKEEERSDADPRWVMEDYWS